MQHGEQTPGARHTVFGDVAQGHAFAGLQHTFTTGQRLLGQHGDAKRAAHGDIPQRGGQRQAVVAHADRGRKRER